MNSLLKIMRGTKDGLRFMGFVLASLLLPQHGKRLIFIASLYCYFARLDALSDGALDKLNNAMSLAKYGGSSLRLPAAVRDVVWGGIDVQAVINMDVFDNKIAPKRAREIAEKVVALSPRWLRYRSREAMIGDVRKLIQNTTDLSANAA